MVPKWPPSHRWLQIQDLLRLWFRRFGHRALDSARLWGIHRQSHQSSWHRSHFRLRQSDRKVRRRHGNAARAVPRADSNARGLVKVGDIINLEYTRIGIKLDIRQNDREYFYGVEEIISLIHLK